MTGIFVCFKGIYGLGDISGTRYSVICIYNLQCYIFFLDEVFTIISTKYRPCVRLYLRN